jgi:lipoate-protein ligase A
MLLCDLTLPTPEENLACEEALLDSCEAGGSDEVLRFWESTKYFIVVGYANHAATEVNLPFCERNTIPVLRRCTGGGTVLQGPGCLNYTLVLRISESHPSQSISATNEFVLSRHQEALASLLRAPVEKKGHTDLAIGGLKFSGNAQRRRKNFLLFHGSFLLHADVDLIEKALPLPSKQPDYRLGRSHADFLMNLKVPSSLVKSALIKTWKAAAPLEQVPFAQIGRLVEQKYGREEWNRRF